MVNLSHRRRPIPSRFHTERAFALMSTSASSRAAVRQRPLSASVGSPSRNLGERASRPPSRVLAGLAGIGSLQHVDLAAQLADACPVEEVLPLRLGQEA